MKIELTEEEKSLDILKMLADTEEAMRGLGAIGHAVPPEAVQLRTVLRRALRAERIGEDQDRLGKIIRDAVAKGQEVFFYSDKKLQPPPFIVRVTQTRNDCQGTMRSMWTANTARQDPRLHGGRSVMPIDEDFAEQVADLLWGTDREPWFAARDLGFLLDTLELKELRDLLFWHCDLVICEGCELLWTDYDDRVALCWKCDPDHGDGDDDELLDADVIRRRRPASGRRGMSPSCSDRQRR